MTKDEIFNETIQLMREYFDDGELVLTRDTTAHDVAEWDSMSHVNIIAAIEQQFKVRFSTGELEHLDNVGDLVDAIANKIGLNSKRS